MAEPLFKDDRPASDAAVADRKSVPRDESYDKAKEPAKRASFGRRLLVIAILATVVVAAAIAGRLWWLHARNFESTDDAFVDTRIAGISSQVSGAIVAVAVTDNELVAKGATLIDIDPRDYQVAVAQAQAQVAQAQAQVAQAKATIANLDAQLDAQKARIDQALKQVEQTKAALTFAQQEHDRNQDLMRNNAGTRQQLQQATSNFIQAQDNVASAEANAVATQKQIPVLETQRQGVVAQVAQAKGQLQQAQAQLQQAEINLSRTHIVAREAGRATKISAAVGAIAQPGQVLMMFVSENKWVTANFKETQLALMRPGEPVDIAIDAYPDEVFRGHVDSIQAGSGPAFSLLPPENATGNFVKVVQRVPVKIVFDTPPTVYIGPGMSVVPTVRVR
jgi:membrane fusion protein (multidrug efflux system)